MLKVDVGSLVGVLAFLSAIFLAIVVILFNDLGRGLRLDRHLIITRVLHLPGFITLTTALCGLLFVAILSDALDWVWLHRILWLLTVAVSLAYFMSAILIVISAIGWLNSEEYSSPWRGSYREAKRLKYLTRRGYTHTLAVWQEFWHDDKTYTFLGKGHFMPYIKAFLSYLAQVPPEYQAEAEELFSDFILAMLRMQKQENVTPEASLFGYLLAQFEQAYDLKSYQLREWGRLIQSYLGIMRLQDLAALDVEPSVSFSLAGSSPSDSVCDDGFLQRSFLEENPNFIKNPWRDSFEYYLADGFCMSNNQAARALARLIWQHYRGLGNPSELKKFFRARRRISGGATRRLYSELIKSIDASNAHSLGKFLTDQAKLHNSDEYDQS